MENREITKSVILRYFQSWQEPADYSEFRACLDNNMIFDCNLGIAVGADVFTELSSKREKPWKDVQLLASVYDENCGSIIYNGTDVDSGKITRISEHLYIKNGYIKKITAVICTVVDTNSTN